MKQKNIDLTQGTIWKVLALFLFPIFVGNFFQQLYTTADAVIIGQFTGKTGLASIDSVYSLLKLPVNFFVGLSTGATILISQLFGAKKEAELTRAVHTTVAFGFAGGAVLSVLGLFAAPACLRYMDIPESIFQDTLSYVRIYFAGFLFSMLYNIGAGVLRAAGNSKTPFYVLLLSGMLNVVLDLIFVGAFCWGVPGAALATVLAQMISALLILLSLIKQLRLRPQLHFYLPAFKSVMVLGIPTGLQSSLYPIANMMIQASINRTGTDNIAAWALCGKLDFLIWLSADSLAAAISIFAAQNYGAQQYRRVRDGVWTGLIMSISCVLFISFVLFVWCEPLGKLFIAEEDYDVIPIVNTLMRFLSPFYFIYVFGEVFSSAIRGAGETLKPMVLTLTGTCGLRILWVLFVVPQHNSIFSIISSYPVSWIFTSCLFIVYYRMFRKKYLGKSNNCI